MQNQIQNTSQAPAVISQAIKDYTAKHKIPEEGLTILGGKPYLNFCGLIYKAKSLGLKSIRVEILKEATPTDLSAKVKATVVLKDGSEYEDFGFGSNASIKMSTLHSADYINMTTITRAKNRALRSATGVGLVSAEEMEGQPTCHNTGQDNASKLLNKAKKTVEGEVVKPEQKSEPEKIVENELALNKLFGCEKEPEQKKEEPKMTMEEGNLLLAAIEESDSELDKVLEFYKVKAIYDLSNSQALDLSKKLKAKQDAKTGNEDTEIKKIEEQDKKDIQTSPPVEKKESKAAKAMREGKEKAKQDFAIKEVPENVCKYLNTIKNVNDLPYDILTLQLDCNKGNFKGEKAYPNLKAELEKYKIS